MQVNRYTQFQPARYNPRTLQELMIAPMYKREQHDNLLNTSAELESAIAQVDPLDIHSETAAAEQKRLYDEITKQVDMLNTEGFNPSAKSNFIKLNKQYQQAIAPTGILGKVNAAKAKLNENREKYIQGAIEAGYSPTQAQQNWEEFQSTYAQQFEKTGAVENIGELYAPKYYDYIEEGRKLFKDAGVTSTDISSGGGKIVVGDDGSYVVNTQSRDVNSSNIRQLEAAVDFLNNRIQNPNSDVYKSILHQRKTPQDALNELAGLADVFVRDETGRQRSSSIDSYRPGDKDETGPVNYIKDVIQGYNIKNISADSPLNNLEGLENATFDNNGNLITPEGGYKTYQEKIKALQESKDYSSVDYDPNTGLYKATFKAAGSPGPGASTTGLIPKDPQHYKTELEKIRTDNPSLKGLSDRELINRMSEYRESLASNYVNSLEIPNANYEWMNDRLFGNQQGSGERSTGMFDSKGATINGEQYTATEVIDKLGFDNIKEFKEKGQPTVRGYVPAFGKWRVSAANDEGEYVNLFLDDITEFKDKTTLSRNIAQLAFEGKTFAPIGRTPDGQTLYYVNDFIEPKIVKSYSGMTSAAQIPVDHMNTSRTYGEVSAREAAGLVNDPLFQQLSNIKKD